MMGEVIRVSGRAPDVGDFLREAMLSQRFADVALCCPGGQKFLAHRLVLSAASPYLQEVLLAHSKTSAHCEPITVILAEVEAPELAAILGFVYTGSATVPRPRLDAFLRAAEALRVTLPPLPVAMARDGAECKQEDVKDVKVSPRYLQCDQYPSCDRWYRPGRNSHSHSHSRSHSHPHPISHSHSLSLDEDSGNKKESYSGTSSFEATRNDRPLGDSIHFGSKSYDRSYSPTTWSSFTNVASPDKSIHRLDPSLDKDRGTWLDGRNYHPASVMSRIDRSNDEATATSTEMDMDSEAHRQRQDLCVPAGPSELHGRLDPLELRLTTRGDYEETTTSDRAKGKFAITENESADSCSLDRIGERIGVIRSLQSRATSLQYPAGRTRSYEKSDYGQDLTCGESCCRWRTPRRHVANRVTASPWRQIVRPHHSPKPQPMILRTPIDDTEVGDNVQHAPETARAVAASSSPDHRSPNSAATTENLYGFQVPTTREASFSDNSTGPIDESTGTTERRLREFYAPQVPFVAQTVPRVIPPVITAVRDNEIFPRATTRSLSSSEESGSLLSVNETKADAHFGRVIPQTPRTPRRPELSHPISRLCDTIESSESSERSDRFNGRDVKKLEEETLPEEKVAGRNFVNSDSNNNDAIAGSDSPRRGRSSGVQEEHRCDQCGKTFVTRASLKVHSRTHSGEKPFRCADCGKQFSQLRNYKYHRSVHEGTREFAATCPECGKYFNDRGYLSSHMKIHRNRKEYGCAECGKSFNQRVAYNMHVRIHTGVKPHQCEQCGKAFSRKMLLKQHLRTHSGERPYQCQVCQKAFADRSNMTLHTRLHSGLKPYQCTLCSKAFTKKHHLKTHLNYHTGTKPYSCPNCALRFSQSSNMRTHFKKCAVNNPAATVRPTNDQAIPLESSNLVDLHRESAVSRTPSDALTPPNSDQESSILTPISKI